MTINNYMTQPEMVEAHLEFLENGRIDFSDKYTLNTLFPYCVKKVTDNEVLFFNKNGEVIIDFLNDLFYIEDFNKINDIDFYRKPENFDYLFIKFKMQEDIIFLFDEKLTKRDIPKYLQKVRAFLALLPN
ncbi:hypothetical protein ACIB15232_0160 [Aliarcobacter cibarius]|uniref:hypothetical protein n=1 Tax=Aliarcobacter cibarius TaxID=255507 RepID=UPI0012453959|nr:hypothetical protein [Aliarcobacter cibarius]QEZ88357.1 hypothetical protein ACIB15232_0160 [Aliarcobacter cibarius]